MDYTILIIVLVVIALLVYTVIRFPFGNFRCFKIIQEYESVVIFRLGRRKGGGIRGPGMFFVIPFIDSYSVIDMRMVSFDVSPQEVLTKDCIIVTVEAVVYYKIYDPIKAVVEVTNYSDLILLEAMATLRNTLATKTITEILPNREGVSNIIQMELDAASYPYGIKVERVKIINITLSNDLQTVMEEKVLPYFRK